MYVGLVGEKLHFRSNFFRGDVEYGMRVAQGLGVDISGFIPSGK
ncbi:hypothetical protein FHR92_001175 [Fontibacillus solani]|uniref:Uncharacterized protein n=1 Tax=Fontibacillus solani TaxID=1572857 RepID=A0A7W3SRG6_9BACL|nr:hypothetical protein [Fontibacillus solani]MBA9084714.1 hypothetical protein [Fontibacillus solani]